jgi:hypothetical protein
MHPRSGGAAEGNLAAVRPRQLPRLVAKPYQGNSRSTRQAQHSAGRNMAGLGYGQPQRLRASRQGRGSSLKSQPDQTKRAREPRWRVSRCRLPKPTMNGQNAPAPRHYKPSTGDTGRARAQGAGNVDGTGGLRMRAGLITGAALVTAGATPTAPPYIVYDHTHKTAH